MKPNGRILDRNLHQLLTRAYRPLEIQPSFRQALAARVAQRANELYGPIPAVLPARRVARWPLALAAAAALLLLWLVVSNERQDTPLEGPLVEGGNPAPSVLETPDGAPELVSSGMELETRESGTRVPEELVPDEVPQRLASTTPEEEALRARLSGNVRLGSDDRPVERFRVVLLEKVKLPDVADPEEYDFTDRDHGGRFRIEGIKPATYTVFVQTDGLPMWTRTDVSLGTDSDSALDIELNPGAIVRGRVIDERNGQPIEGAVVLSESDAPTQVVPIDLDELPASFQALARTGPDGRFELGPLSVGRHVLRASGAGHAPAWSAPIPLEAGQQIDGLALKLGPPATVSGRIAHGAGVIVASLIDMTGLRQRMCAQIAASGEDGHFELKDLPAGYYVILNALEKNPRIHSLVLAEGEHKEVDFFDQRGGTCFRGRLLAPDGTPLSAYDITLMPTDSIAPDGSEQDWNAVRTDVDGRFEFLSLEAGEYLVYFGVDMGIHMVQHGPIQVPGTEFFERDIRLRAGRIEGRVEYVVEGVAAPWLFLLRVDVDRPQLRFAGKLTADAQGRFRFDHLAAGEYELIVAPLDEDHAQAKLEDVFLAPGQTLELAPVRLELGGTLLVQVTLAGQPVRDAELQLYDPEDQRHDFGPNQRTNERGELFINGLVPGAWHLIARHDGKRAETTVHIRTQEQTRLELPLKP